MEEAKRSLAITGPLSNDDLSIIPDLSLDTRFKDRPFIFTYPYNKFYAGCPIRTNRGIDIGVLCVFDPEPRPEGLTASQQEVMLDISTSIMAHLDDNRIRHESRRSERMVRGIGSFVEGSSTLAGWWSNADTSAFSAHTGGEGILDPAQQHLAKHATINPVSGRETSVDDPKRDDPKRSGSSNSPREQRDQRLAPESISEQDHARDTQKENSSSLRSSSRASFAHVLSPQEVHRRSIQTAFAKASNIIRESLEVEGVIFLDARVSIYAGLVDSKCRDSTTSLSENSDKSSGNSDTTMQSTTIKSDTTESAGSRADEPACKLLAFATSDNSTINQSLMGGQYNLSETSLKAFIRRYPSGTVFNFDGSGLLQSSDSEASDATTAFAASYGATESEAGSAAEDASSTLPKRKRRTRRSKINDGSTILKLLPGARAAVFFPLWDQDRQRWFAGAIAWSGQLRPFSIRGELSYLAAFGNTIMSQVARLEALMVDKAKTDLLGSISHELRSPLHGVLGGVEMLADTNIDPFQNDVLHTIETCGKTLLDTMDHLLDFAKINNFSHGEGGAISRARKATRSKKSRRDAVKGDNFAANPGVRRLFADVELDILVEEVMESVSAGQQFFSRMRDEDAHGSPTRTKGGRDYSQSLLLGIVLDIDYAQETASDSTTAGQVKNWTFNVVPGGLRRVVMNVFGNALKYTDHGSVRVSLSSRPASKAVTENGSASSSSSTPSNASSKSNIQEVVLTVTDTGRGISPNFLDNHMFLPFTQEDRLNPGTGLGLSVAHQIVSNLNGTIGVRSDVGIGTEFTITIPLAQPTRSRSRDTSSSSDNTVKELAGHIKAAKGLRVALIGFSAPDDASRSSEEAFEASLRQRRGSYDAAATQWTLPRAEIENICRAKLAMEVLPAPSDLRELSGMVPRPELLLTTEQYLDQLIKDLTTMKGLGADHVMPPIVAVCPSIAVAKMRARSQDKSRAVVDFISQPCGPRKLADAFALSLMRWSEHKGTETESESELASPDLARTADEEEAASTLESQATGQTPSLTLADRTKSQDSSSTSLVQKRHHFLLVEDNPINMRILISFMRKKKLPHFTAENGLLALESYRQNHSRYTCILMDISMPVMTGLEASREIRRFEGENGLCPVRIVALTALASEGVREEAFASGIDLFLTKPVRLKELEGIIEKKKRGSADASSEEA